MGLLVLVVIGAVLGWLGTIVTRVENTRGILTSVAAGIAGSVVTGIIAGSGVLFGAISGTALLWATVGAVVLVALALGLARRTLARQEI